MYKDNDIGVFQQQIKGHSNASGELLFCAIYSNGHEWQTLMELVDEHGEEAVMKALEYYLCSYYHGGVSSFL